MKRESLETVQSEIRDRIERMAGYLDRYQQCKQRNGKEKILGKIMLNGIYLKRYLNLILLSLQQEGVRHFFRFWNLSSAWRSL